MKYAILGVVTLPILCCILGGLAAAAALNSLPKILEEK